MARPASLLLASKSPRRRALLEGLGFVVTVADPSVDETWPGGEPGAAAIVIARRKLAAVPPQDDDEGRTAAGRAARVALAADTVVVIDDEPLGKPLHGEDAARMLGRLSGREHVVITGFSVRGGGRQKDAAVRTAVRFRELSKGEIDRYVASGEPLDKAGAYGIQGLGGGLVECVRGSYTNIVGLPLAEVLAAIEDVWTNAVCSERHGGGTP